MKRFIIGLVICLGFLAIVNNDAYSKKKGASTTGGTKIGLGVSLNPMALLGNDGEMMFLPVSMMNIYLPIQIGTSFRIEPEFGIYRQSETVEFVGGSADRVYSFIRLGVGAFKTINPANNFLMYFGPRIGILMTSSEIDYSFDPDTKHTLSQNIITIGGSVGGEYYLSDHFSLGAEVQLNYFSYGDQEETPDEGDDSETTQTIITTNGLIFARFYFR